MQGPGLTLSAAEKVRVARKLDELGVHLIEAGFPSSNPKELELFELLAQERFEHADVAALGVTRRGGGPRSGAAAPAPPPGGGGGGAACRPPRTTACACSPSASRRCARSSARP